MGFERIQLYKKEAQKYIREELDTDTLALKLRETCPKAWIKVRNNCKKVWPGEIRKEIKDESGKITEIWMYRPTDNYDTTLFSLLYLRFERTIYAVWRKISGYVDIDDYLDATEDWICQSIRHFEPEKGNFSSLANTMLNLAATNLINRNTTITRVRDKETGEIISKEVKYHPTIASLEDIMSDQENPLNYQLPKTEDTGYSIIKELKDKYKRNNDFVTWSLLDVLDNDSQILDDKRLHKCTEKLNPYNFKTLIPVLLNMIEKDLLPSFGFHISNKSEFDMLEESKKIKVLKHKCNDSIARLKNELQQEVIR